MQLRGPWAGAKDQIRAVLLQWTMELMRIFTSFVVQLAALPWGAKKTQSETDKCLSKNFLAVESQELIL